MLSPGLKIYRNVKYGRERSANINLLGCSFHLSPPPKKKSRMQLIFEKHDRSKMQEINGGKEEREREILWRRSDSLLSFATKGKDRTVISHQTGKLSASRAEVVVMQQSYRDFS